VLGQAARGAAGDVLHERRVGEHQSVARSGVGILLVASPELPKLKRLGAVRQAVLPCSGQARR
jgi:hypothetical protein